MASDDLRERLRKAMTGPFLRPQEVEDAAVQTALGTDVLGERLLDRLEAVARAHASERIESFVAGAAYCPFCGRHADSEHAMGCAIESGVAFR